MHFSCWRIVRCKTRRAIATRNALVLLTFAVSAAPSRAETFDVGSDPKCTHTTLEAAFAAAAANTEPDLIRLGPVFHSVFSELEIENDSVELVGGFPFCSAPSPSPSSFGWVTSMVPGGDLFWVHGTGPTQLIVHNLQIDVGAPGRRVVRLEGRGLASFHNSSLADGQATEGGNVWMNGPETVL